MAGPCSGADLTYILAGTPIHHCNKHAGGGMADHIKIKELDGNWVVRANGAVLGQTAHALELREGDYAPVIYIPRADMNMALLERSDTTSVCPHKGDASYFSIRSAREVIKDAAWSYETPIDGAAEIAGHLAFRADRAVVERL